MKKLKDLFDTVTRKKNHPILRQSCVSSALDAAAIKSFVNYTRHFM